MLSKLIRHEFRATGRVMLPLYLILLVLSLGANISTRRMLGTDIRILNLLGSLLLIAFIAAIFGVCIMSLVLMAQRFQKNLMGDEGYIMFTLPVSVHEHIWSKLLVSSVWFIVTIVVVFIACGILVSDVQFIKGIFEMLQRIFRDVTMPDAMNSVLFILEFILLAFVSCAAFSLQFYAALSVGHSFPNHKMALSVAAFFIFQFIMQFLTSLLIICLDNLRVPEYVSSLWNLEGWAAMHAVIILMICAVAVYGAVYYAITAVTLQNRLNLE